MMSSQESPVDGHASTGANLSSNPPEAATTDSVLPELPTTKLGQTEPNTASQPTGNGPKAEQSTPSQPSAEASRAELVPQTPDLKHATTSKEPKKDMPLVDEDRVDEFTFFSAVSPDLLELEEKRRKEAQAQKLAGSKAKVAVSKAELSPNGLRIPPLPAKTQTKTTPLPTGTAESEPIVIVLKEEGKYPKFSFLVNQDSEAMNSLPEELKQASKLMETMEQKMKGNERDTQVFQFDKNQGSLRHASELEGTELHNQLQELLEKGSTPVAVRKQFSIMPAESKPAQPPPAEKLIQAPNAASKKPAISKVTISSETHDAVQQLLEQRATGVTKKVPYLKRMGKLPHSSKHAELNDKTRKFKTPPITIPLGGKPVTVLLGTRQVRHVYIAECIKKNKWASPHTKSPLPIPHDASRMPTSQMPAASKSVQQAQPPYTSPFQNFSPYPYMQITMPPNLGTFLPSINLPMEGVSSTPAVPPQLPAAAVPPAPITQPGSQPQPLPQATVVTQKDSPKQQQEPLRTPLILSQQMQQFQQMATFPGLINPHASAQKMIPGQFPTLPLSAYSSYPGMFPMPQFFYNPTLPQFTFHSHGQSLQQQPSLFPFVTPYQMVPHVQLPFGESQVRPPSKPAE